MMKFKRQFFRGVRTITEKNIKIYYSKAPVLIFGLLFPLFLFLAFYLGRDVNMLTFFPGLLAMSLFFISSSVGPLITPWERSFGTYERLLSFPVNINTIILGNITAGVIFGIALNIVVLIAGLLFLNYSINIWCFLAGLLIGSFAFSSLGVLIASPPTYSPSHIMMFSSLIRFPLIFISGIFIPLGKLGSVGKTLSFFSPVTYLVDIFNFSFKGEQYFPVYFDFVMLILFSFIFWYLANIFHRKSLIKGL